jgi:multidrug efflux pump subunit AcrB
MYSTCLAYLMQRKGPVVLLLTLLIVASSLITWQTQKSLYPKISAPEIMFWMFIPSEVRDNFQIQYATPFEESLKKENRITKTDLRISEYSFTGNVTFEYGIDYQQAELRFKELLNASLGATIPEENISIWGNSEQNGAYFVKVNFPDNMSDQTLEQLDLALNSVPEVANASLINYPSIRYKFFYQPIAGIDNTALFDRLELSIKRWVLGKSLGSNADLGTLKEAAAGDLIDWVKLKGDQDAFMYTNRLSHTSSVSKYDQQWLDETGPADLIWITVEENADLLQAEAAIETVLKDFNLKDFTFTYNPANILRESFDSIYTTLALAASVLLLLLLVLLADWRKTLIVVGVLPVSLLLTTAYLSLTGSTMNLILLGAISLAIGIAVDSAVVVTHSLHQARASEKMLSLQRVFKPLALGTLTNVLAFLPLIIISQGPAAILGELVIVMVLTCVFSWLCSLFVLPVLLASNPTSNPSSKPSLTLNSVVTDIDRSHSASWLIKGLAQINLIFVRHPLCLIATACLLIAGCGYSAYQLSQSSYVYFEEPKAETMVFRLGSKSPEFKADGYQELQVFLQGLHHDYPEQLTQTLFSWAQWGVVLFVTSKDQSLFPLIEDRIKQDLTNEFSLKETYPFIPTGLDLSTPNQAGLQFIDLTNEEYRTLEQWVNAAKAPEPNPRVSEHAQSEQTVSEQTTSEQAALEQQNHPLKGLTPSENPALGWSEEHLLNWTATAMQSLDTEQRQNLKSYITSYWEPRRIAQTSEGIQNYEYRLGIAKDYPLDQLLVPVGDDLLPVRYLITLESSESPKTKGFHQSHTRWLLSFEEMTATQKDSITKAVKALGIDPMKFSWVNPRADIESLLIKLGYAALGVALIMMLISYFFYNQLSCGLLVASISTISALIASAITAQLEGSVTMGIGIGALLLIGLSVNNLFLLFDSRIRAPLGNKRALIHILNERTSPILSTTATTLVCSIPMALSSGLESSFLKPIGSTLISGMIISSALSLLFYPAIVLRSVKSDHTDSPSFNPATENALLHLEKHQEERRNERQGKSQTVLSETAVK